MCYWWFVDASSSIDINRVDYLKRGLVALMFVLGLVLAGRREKERPIRSEGQSSEERG